MIERRYLTDGKYAKNAAADTERRKLLAVVELFKKYGAQYDMDYLLMVAQGYQESTLDHSTGAPWARLASCRSCRQPGRS